MKEKISIVVPVYNAQPYLRACLDSIQRQTWDQFEGWLVDDGSQDGSGEICDAYAEKDARFRVIHQENAGVSPARNAGMRAATGDYICFADADDWLEPAYLERLAAHFGPDTDLSMCGHCLNDGPLCRPRNGNDGNALMAGDEALAFIVSDRFSGVWNKMFRLSRIREMNLLYDPDISVGEDLQFVFEYMKGCSGGLRYFPERLYHYRQTEEGLSRKDFTASRMSLFTVLDRLEKEISETGDPYPRTETAVRNKRVYCGMVSLMLLMTGGNQLPEKQAIRKQLKEYCRKDLGLFLHAEDYTFAEKAAVALTAADPVLGGSIYKILKGFLNRFNG